MVDSVSASHAGEDPDDDRVSFKEVADTHMVEFGSSSITGGRREDNDLSSNRGDDENGVGVVDYADESFIATNANQHDDTMFYDDIASALLNGINSNANAATNANNISHNMSNQFIMTPRDAIEHSIIATDGSNLNQSVTSLGQSG